jgi:mannitol-specific phosphotransferase system IIBC component
MPRHSNPTRKRTRKRTKSRSGGMGSIASIIHKALPTLVLFEALRATKKKINKKLKKTKTKKSKKTKSKKTKSKKTKTKTKSKKGGRVKHRSSKK